MLVVITGRLDDDWKKRRGFFVVVVVVDVAAQHDGVRGRRRSLAGWGFKLLLSAAERMGRVLVCSIVSVSIRLVVE